MADWSPIYETGTASVSASGTTVTGQSTNWMTAGLRPGDQFKAAGLSTTIVSINSNTSLTIKPWPGSTRTTDNYEIIRLSDADRLIAANADLMAALVPNLVSLGGLTLASNKGIHATGAGTLATHDLTPFARTLLGDANAAAARGTLGANDAANLNAGILPSGRLPFVSGESTAELLATETNPTVTYTANRIRYLKVGRLVLFAATIQCTLSAAGSGNIRISGLPFAYSTYESSAMPVAVGINTLFNNPVSADLASGNELRIIQQSSGAATPASALIVGGLRYFYVGGMYATSA